MATLYDLTGDMLKLQELLEEGTLDQEVLADAMQYTKEELEDKLQDYCKIIKHLSFEISAIKEEEKRLKARRSSLETNLDNMKGKMLEAMKACQVPKSKGAFFTVYIKKNAPSLVIDKEAALFIPEEYLEPQPPKINNEKVKEVLSGKDEAAKAKLEGIAYLQSTESLTIR